MRLDELTRLAAADVGFGANAGLAGGDDDSLMRLVGWKTRQPLHHYGASAADAHAREADHRPMLGDRI